MIGLRGLEEVLRCVVLGSEGRAVEIVEHEVHVLAFLDLQIIADLNVPMNLDLNVRVCLTRQGSRFRKPSKLN